MSDIYIAHLHLRSASEHALIANWTEGFNHAHHVEETRMRIVQALAGCEAGDGYETARECLLDTINNAIADSFDVDWKTEDAARLVLEYILDEVAPLPKSESEAA